MSWNPRRFARDVSKSLPWWSTLIWLDIDAQHRLDDLMGSVVELEFARSIPDSGVMITFSDTPGLLVGVPAVEHRKALIDSLPVEQRLPPFIPGEAPADVSSRIPFVVLGPGRQIIAAWVAYEYGDEIAVEYPRGSIQSDGSDSGPTYYTGAVLTALSMRMLQDPQLRDDAAMTVDAVEVSTGKHGSGRRNRDMTVTVVDVRRPSHPGERTGGGSPVEHDHRWPVRGHWRNQPCGPGHQDRRRIWIDEHVAGPEDKPLKQGTRVYRI